MISIFYFSAAASPQGSRGGTELMWFKISSDFASPVRNPRFSNRVKNVLTPILGFGLAGAVWGLEAYNGTVGSDDIFVNPFSYILGAFAFGLLGSLSLVLFSGDIKKILKVVGIGLLGWVLGFLAPAVAAYQLFIGGSVFLSVILYPFGKSEVLVEKVPSLFGLDPSFPIGSFVMEFFLTGLIVGLAYALILKLKILKTVLYGAGGFALASLISPIIGNLIGNLFHSLFIAYMITFTLIGIIFGLSIVMGGLRRQASP